jgi:chromosome segregation ATPase
MESRVVEATRIQELELEIAKAITAQQAAQADKKKAEAKILELEQKLMSMKVRITEAASQRDSVGRILRQQTAVIGGLQRELLTAQSSLTSQLDTIRAQQAKILELEQKLISVEIKFTQTALQRDIGRLVLAWIHPDLARFIPRRVKQYIKNRVVKVR